MISPVETWVAEKTGLHKALTPETLLQWQHEKLKSLLQYTRKNSRFYREKLSNHDNLAELPFTYPADIENDPLAFLALPQNSVARVTTLTTSGSTGNKKRIYFSESDLERTIDFFAVGMSTLVSRGQNALILLSDDTENSLGSLLRTALSGIGVTARILGSVQHAEAAIQAAQNVDCLIGMPSEIFYMSQIAQNLHPESVLLTADFVPQCVIDKIGETWKCRVFTHYGLTEAGFGYAVDCEQHSGHHLRDADLIIEIVDPETGKPVSPGHNGEIVLTTLNNEAMPLIRYRTGDISRLLYEPCGCGGVLLRLGRIGGRMESHIPVGRGISLSIHQLDEVLLADPVIRGFNASLESEGERSTLHLTIDSDGSPDRASLAAALPKGLRIEVKSGKADPFSCRGKKRIHIG